jgi:hypothetical protein
MHSDLIAVIRQVRRRWRLKLALRGAVGVIGLGLLVVLAGAFGLEAARFSAGAIVTFRIVTIAAFLVLTAFLLVRPLVQRVSDEQVALYLEEHEPSLQAEIISAVEATASPKAPAPRASSFGASWSPPSRSAARSMRVAGSSAHRCGSTQPPLPPSRSSRSAFLRSALPICGTHCRPWSTFQRALRLQCRIAST